MSRHVWSSLVALGLAGATGLAVASGAPAPNPYRLDALEPGETHPGGATTYTGRLTRAAFSHPAANMGFDDEMGFRIGDAVFERLWVTAPASTQASDGLGPLFNARACQQCHIRDGRGHPPLANWPDDNAVSMLLRLSVPARTQGERALLASGRAGAIPEPVYGGQLQDFAVPGHPGEGRMHITYEELPVELADGTIVSLRAPTYAIPDPGYGPMDPDVMVSPRVAPPMIGLGLLELIPQEAILANADPDDADGDGISGRPNRVWSKEARAVVLGRFGWKALEPTVNQQNAHAFLGDIGLSSALARDGAGDCTAAQTACRAAPTGDSPQYDNLEVAPELMEMLLFYTRHLAVPARRRRSRRAGG